MGDATTVDMKAWDRDIRINVTSMVLMCRFAVPEMRRSGRGAIVNLSSVSGSKLNPPLLLLLGIFFLSRVLRLMYILL